MFRVNLTDHFSAEDTLIDNRISGTQKDSSNSNNKRLTSTTERDKVQRSASAITHIKVADKIVARTFIT